MKYLFLVACLAGMFLHQRTFSKGTDQATKIEIREQWKFKQESTDRWYSAEVPGCVHTDLMNNNLIPDPFVGINEQSMQWIGEKNWIYETAFDVSAEVFKNNMIELVFEGLDTYAEVTLNDSLVLRANNMFRTWRVDCRSLLRARGNRLTLRFRNVFDENLPKYKAAPFELQAFPNNDQADVKIAMYSRKAQFHYGWDWGPRLITCGIWRPVYLHAWSNFKIRDIQIQQQNISSQGVDILSTINLLSERKQRVRVSIAIDTLKFVPQTFSLSMGDNNLELRGHLANPNLWWPNGLGEHYLYSYNAVLSEDSGYQAEYSTKIGIRSLEVVREKDSLGRSMYIRINGVPVFMKGANYIPQDNFQPRVTKKRYEHIIRSAADANMNMLRVWGGGIYEHDQFYDLCDQYGILVWQDMMFACAMYPGEEEFLSNVRQEVIDNATRIRNHACLAMYCGNNENEISWHQWGWKQKYDDSTQRLFEQSSQTLFSKVIPSALREVDSIRYYHVTSPITGYNAIANGEGDNHYWGVWHGKDPFENFAANISRFVSEYGFQSYPELSTIFQYAKPEDRHLHSAVMLSHQRCMADERRDKEYGNRLIQLYMDRWYRTPKDFASYVYVSQILQAEGVRMAMEAHRRAMPYCMGSLYWQIDDCWPVASWSSIDYYGRWKALHYTAKKTYASILISPIISDDDVKFTVISDQTESVEAMLEITVMDFRGKKVFQKLMKEIIKPNTSEVVAVFQIHRMIGSVKKSRLVLVSRLKKGNNILAEQISYFKVPKELELGSPKIKTSLLQIPTGYRVELTANSLARNVYLACGDENACCSDNYFDLLPRAKKTITVSTAMNKEDFKRTLKIVSLVDSFR